MYIRMTEHLSSSINKIGGKLVKLIVKLLYSQCSCI